MKRSALTLLLGCCVLLLWPTWAAAQDFGFQPPPDANNVMAPSIMRDLAERIIPVYQDADADAYLTNMAALQLITHDYGAAYDTSQTLRARHQNVDADRPVDRAILYEIYAHARAIEDAEKIPFPQAFQRSFHDVVPQLDNTDAAAVMARLEAPLPVFAEAVQHSFDRWRADGNIPLPDAMELVRRYLAFEAHRSFAPFVAALNDEEDRRRYVAPEEVTIKLAGRAVIHAVIVRPNSKTALPTLLRFALQPSQDDARESAAHGYVGVVAYTQGRETNGHGAVVPFVHEGEDAREVINWIAKQPWSDGRVGMVGDGYSGFVAWAAAKRLPAALKAIATGAPMAPGIDFPMKGGIEYPSALRWIDANTQDSPPETYPNEEAKWRALEQIAYASGKPYRDADRLFLGKRNALFQTWLQHPGLDRYWQNLQPSAKEFEHINIPVLTLAGYYGGDAGALYYFDQHLRHDAKADHTLLVGPYDAESIRHGTAPTLRGYTLDAVAAVDLRELRYQWLDHVFKNAAKPALLSDRVNLQMMGTNEWRHAPTLAALGTKPLRLYLDTVQKDKPKLLNKSVEGGAYLEQVVDLDDRKDAQALLATGIVFKSLPITNAIAFVSDPLPQPMEIEGALSGQLDFLPNKRDVDLSVTLYEKPQNGDLIRLFDPYDFRASDAEDRSSRHLLKAGVRQQMKFTAERLTGRKLPAGSQLILVLGVNKRPDRQINYGTGKAVADESIADAKTPLRIRWYGGTAIDVPVHR